ncbi:MAG TPA: TonB-dependent receptor [Steroidobacteraceae bacterium]|nr:TonB-dependent receptor [Steroidobacteraceae bacterium]
MPMLKCSPVFGILLLMSSFVHADTADQTLGAADTLDKVIVTATKMEVTQRELTQPSEIVTQEQIAAQAQTSVTDVLRQQPGIQFQVGGAPGQFIYPRLRGFSDSTTYVFDGITMNAGGSGDIGYLLGRLDPTMVQSIQVLRGPRATTYGANTTSGVIDFTTLAATGREADVGIEGGSLDWRKYRVGLQDQEPLADGTWAATLNGSYVDSGGEWQYEYTKNATVVGRTSFKDSSFEVGLSFYLTKNVFQAAALDQYYPGYTGGDFSVQLPDSNDPDTTKAGIGSLWFQQQLTTNLSQRLTIGYAGQDVVSTAGVLGNGGLIGYYAAPYDGFSDPDSGGTYAAGDQVAVYQYPYFYKTVNDNTEADYNLRYKTDTASAVLGATYLEQIFDASSSYSTYNRESQSTKSVYADASIGWLDNRLHTDVGARLDSYSAWKNKATYSAGLAYEIVHDFTFYANYGTSFTQPTLDQLYDPLYGNKGITPENASTIEAGFRGRQLDGQLTENLTFWHSYVDNVISFDYNIYNPRILNGPPYGAYGNNEAERSQGVEVEAAFKITPQLTLTGNYTRTDSYIAHNGVWQFTIYNARNMGNLGLTWSQAQFDVGSNLFMTDHRRDYSGDFYAPGYARLDFFGRWHATGQFDLYARVQNALDHHIIEILGYRNPGVYFIAGATYKFR